jgi:hypothetical protein
MGAAGRRGQPGRSDDRFAAVAWLGWSTCACQPERGHMGFASVSGSFGTGQLTLVGRAGRAARQWWRTGSDLGRASRAARAGTRAVVGRTPAAGPVLGSTAAGVRSRAATCRARASRRAARALVGCALGACMGGAQAGDARGSRIQRMGLSAWLHARPAADRRALVGRSRRIEIACAGVERAGRTGMGHTEDRRARRASGSFVVRSSHQIGRGHLIRAARVARLGRSRPRVVAAGVWNRRTR